MLFYNHIYRNSIYSNSLIQYGKPVNENVSTLILYEKIRKDKVKKNPEYYIIIS